MQRESSGGNANAAPAVTDGDIAAVACIYDVSIRAAANVFGLNCD